MLIYKLIECNCKLVNWKKEAGHLIVVSLKYKRMMKIKVWEAKSIYSGSFLERKLLKNWHQIIIFDLVKYLHKLVFLQLLLYHKHMLFQESHYKVTGWSSIQNFKQIIQKNKTCQKRIHLSLGIIEHYVALKFYEQFLLNFSRPWPEILVLKLEYWNKGS